MKKDMSISGRWDLVSYQSLTSSGRKQTKAGSFRPLWCLLLDGPLRSSLTLRSSHFGSSCYTRCAWWIILLAERKPRADLTTFHTGTKPAPLVLKLGIPRLGPRFSCRHYGSPDPDIPPSRQCRSTRGLALLFWVYWLSYGHPLVPCRPLEIPGLLASRPVRRC